MFVHFTYVKVLIGLLMFMEKLNGRDFEKIEKPS